MFLNSKNSKVERDEINLKVFVRKPEIRQRNINKSLIMEKNSTFFVKYAHIVKTKQF
jgi:hypothetical protein